MTKVQINSIQLKELRAVALINGTLPQWSELAIEYIDGCEAEILRLREQLKTECDHNYEVVDNSFDHEYGTEVIIIDVCSKCGNVRTHDDIRLEDDII